MGKQKNLHDILEQRGVDEKELENGRAVAMFIAGTGREHGLERMVNYLAENHELPITLVTFEVFKLDDGGQVLVRELTETE